MVNVIARCEIKPDCMEKFLKILLDNVPNVLAEEGCIRYEPNFDVSDGPDADKTGHYVTILETWESEDHLKAHLATKHMAAYRDSVASLRGETTVTVVRPC